jgi:GT2 family glycosyltransferase
VGQSDTTPRQLRAGRRLAGLRAVGLERVVRAASSTTRRTFGAISELHRSGRLQAGATGRWNCRAGVDLLGINLRVAEPELSIVVASHERPLRLRWLLNALERQTLSGALWEVMVGVDLRSPEVARLLESHPLAADGRLRWVRAPEGARGTPGANRNRALGLARGRWVVFTDDDCRPPVGWLERVHAAVHRHPEAVIQGPVEGDPEESVRWHGPYPRSLCFQDVPRVWGECANIVYPRGLLTRLGGFVEDVYTGEDTELGCRARAAGVSYLGDASMGTYHAVEESSLSRHIRTAGRWRDLPLVVRRHPQLREELALRVFWKPTHVWLPLALAGFGLSVRRPLALVLTVPWALRRTRRHHGLRGRMRHLMELPGWALIELAEMAALARGSVQHRSILL